MNPNLNANPNANFQPCMKRSKHMGSRDGAVCGTAIDTLYELAFGGTGRILDLYPGDCHMNQ